MTGRTINVDGIPIFVPNDIVNVTKDFYISYNSRSIGDYGCATTALVSNEPVRFLILNGDHTKQYDQIIADGGGYSGCVEYFRNNQHLKAKHSENWDEMMVFENGKLKVVKI